MEIRDRVRIFFKRWWVLPVALGVCLAGGLMSLQILTPMYQAGLRMQVMGLPVIQSPLYKDAAILQTDAALTISESFRSQDILRQLALLLKLQDRDESIFDSRLKVRLMDNLQKATGLYDRARAWVDQRFFETPAKKDPFPADPVMQAVERLQKRVTVEAIDKTDVIRITVSDPSPEMASRIGNTLARLSTLSSLKRQQSEIWEKYGPSHPLGRQIGDAIRLIESEIINPDPIGRAAFGAGHVKIIQHAFAPTQPTTPKKKYILLMSLAGGLLGGLFLIFWMESVDPTFRDSQDVKRSLSYPLLGSVPRLAWKRLASVGDVVPEDPPDLGMFLPLAYQLRALQNAQGAGKIAFASTEWTKTNAYLIRLLALYMSRTTFPTDGRPQGRVLLVETEFNGNRFLGTPVAAQDTKSMVDYFLGQAEMDQIIRPIEDALAIATIRRGRDQRAPLAFQGPKFEQFMQQASVAYDTVLVRTPAYAKRDDFLFLNTLCRGTILIVNERTTRRQVLKSMRDLLEMNGVKVLGVILDDQKYPIPRLIYHLV